MTDVSLTDSAYARIEEMIVKRELLPGAMVSEAELMAALGMGRTPVREALLRLKQEGFIDVHPRRGAMVTSVDVIKQLDWLELRRPMEQTVVRLAAVRALPDERADLRRLAKLIRTAARSTDRWAFYEANKAIHEATAAAAHNEPLARLMGQIHAHSRRFWYAHTGEAQRAPAAEQHAAVCIAIAEGDVDAATRASAAQMDHIETLIRQMIETRT